MKFKYKQKWINHLERMDNTRLPKHALNYRPRGRRDRGRPRKRWQHVDAGTGQSTYAMEEEDDDDDILLSIV
jgi:predicted ArsR family transcriptional regulator